MTGRTGSRTAFIAIAAFVVLGMPKSAFSIAWPSAADELARDVSDLGVLVAIYVVGYLAGTASMGRLNARVGTARLFPTAAAIATVAIAGYALSGSWPMLIVAAVGLGLSGGWLDAGMNAHVAVHGSARLMGWIHAGFGIGSALGPAAITALLAADRGWQVGFWGIAFLQLAIFAALLFTSGDWNLAAPRSRHTGVPRRAVVPAVLLVFFLYVGLEVAAAQWGYTLLTEGRSMSEASAGATITGFWIALTGVRVLLGVSGDRTPVARAAAYATLAIAMFTLVLWWSPAPWVDRITLVGLGAALGPVFPLQTLLTPMRVGQAATPAMVGAQMAAASVGAIAIPGGLGPLVRATGYEAIPVVLAVAAVGLVIATEWARRLTAGQP